MAIYRLKRNRQTLEKDQGLIRGDYTVLSPKWLSEAVFYQVYPSSFYDSNGDGIGDLKGIIEKLDYIQWLGCNALWINPCYESPFRDGGYDISNYYKVASRYGSNADLKKLFRQAHKKGIRVLLDLVPGHTSIDHPYFKEACENKSSNYSDWFIWNDGSFLSGTANPVIVGYADRPEGFMVNYYWCQPALNYGFAKPQFHWQQPVDAPGPKAVRRELKKMMRFWLDMGADGFRVDMAISCVKNDPDYKETKKLWKGQIRSMLDKEYPEAVIVGECGFPKIALNSGYHADLLLPHVGEESYTELIGNRYEFDIHSNDFFGALDGVKWRDLATGIKKYEGLYRATKSKGYMCPSTASHDIARISHGRSKDTVELIFAWILTMPGIPFVYYGDEIGMRCQVLPNKEGGYKRTGSRTPMQWSNGRNKGFSDARANQLYLPVDPRKSAPVVGSQMDRPNSLLNRVRRLIALRNKHKALQGDGTWKILHVKNKDCLVYLRTSGKEKILVALNPYDKTIKRKVVLPKKISSPETLFTKGAEIDFKNNQMQLNMGPKSFVITKI